MKQDSGLIEGRPESTIVNSFTDVDDQISAFCTVFAELRKDFHLGLSLTAALILSQSMSSVNLKGAYLYTLRHFYFISLLTLSVLKPEVMDETNRTPCFKNTRHRIISDIMEWIADDKAKKVLWVYGLAGSGKSTLSTTIAQKMREVHRLGAFFFFNRDIPQRDRKSVV